MSPVTDEDRAEVTRTRADAAAAIDAGPEVAEVRDLEVAGVACRLYRPADPRGLLLYYHGGGFVYGDLDTHDGHCRRLVDGSGWAMLAVHYRRAPELPFPAAADDAEVVGDWVLGPAGGAAELVGERPVVVAGDSAGANLALLVALRHPAALVGQLQVYPFLDPSGESYDHGLPDADELLPAMAWFWRLYLQGQGVGDLRADPLLAASYAGLPPALVQLAEHDVLTPTGRLLADRLAADGVPVDVTVYPGVGHGFWRSRDNDQYAAALADVCAFLGRWG